MPTPGEHKTVQARILEYAEAIGWTFVPREEAEQRRGFDPDDSSAERARGRSLFFDDLLDAKVREFNPRYAEAEGALLEHFRHLHADIYGNRDFVEHLRNRGKFFDHEEDRERDLILIDYENPDQNAFEVTEEWAFHNGQYGTREDVVFLINGIPVLVIECKNANKDEAIALGVDQIRRYHRETPELFVPEQLFTATDAIGFSYGVSWNTVRRNIFNWKHEDIGKLEATPDVQSRNLLSVHRQRGARDLRWRRSARRYADCRQGVVQTLADNHLRDTGRRACARAASRDRRAVHAAAAARTGARLRRLRGRRQRAACQEDGRLPPVSCRAGRGAGDPASR